MRYSRRKQLFIITILFSAIACLSIGFAAFSTTLNISSSASVTADASQFIVKFSTSAGSLDTSPVTPSSNSYGLATTNGIINNSTNPMVSNLSATFTFPGQYVEYTLYARNEGEYNSYLNSVNFIGDKTCEAVGDASVSLVNSACDSINVVVYVDGEEYRETTEISNHVLEKKTGEQIIIRLEYASDGAAVDGDFRIIFSDVMLVYSIINDPSFMPEYGVSDTSETLYSKIKNDPNFLGTDESVDFGSAPNSGVYVRSGTENHVNPIYYYRGDVDNNIVLFGGFCWKMVRTTETGGVKLVYNGVHDGIYSCANDFPMIGYSYFNEQNDNEEALRYVYADGSDSTIKQYIDKWFAENLELYTDMLEDFVLCNDRGVAGYEYRDMWSAHITMYNGYLRIMDLNKPTFHCQPDFSLSVSNSIKESKLDYPIGLLTADELVFAGTGWNAYNEDAYLNTYDWWWWTSTPMMLEDGNIEVFTVSADGYLMEDEVGGSKRGVRPAISLKSDVVVSMGDGTYDEPYVIE